MVPTEIFSSDKFANNDVLNMHSIIVLLSVLLLGLPVVSSAQDAEKLPPGLSALGLARDCSSDLAKVTSPENPQVAKLAKAIHPALTGSGVLPVSL